MQSRVRRLGPWIAAAVFIAVGSVTIAVAARPEQPGREPVQIEQPSDDGFVFGLDYADQLPQESAAELAHSLSDPAGVGAKWIRVDLAWYRIQPTASTWDWSSFDRTVDYAKARNLKILAILDQPPAWARQAGCAKQLWCPPKDAAQFAAFAARAAQRYPAGVVSAWEVWNEENLGGYWAGGPDPEAYGSMLKATSVAVRAVRPLAQILVGGLAVAGSDGENVSPQDFLLALARSNYLHYATAVGYHPYSYPVSPATAKSFGDISTRPGSLAAILDQFQLSSMPIWLTEAGAQVPDAKDDPSAASATAMNQERQQAAYATELVKAATGNPHVAALFWFSDIDLPDQGLYFGISRADGSHRPSFEALRSAIAAAATDVPHN